MFKKFENFIYAFGATRLLLQRAHDKGFLIEGIVLYASLVDGFCRICLVLKEQIEKGLNDIHEEYIYQANSVPNYSERKIYKLALEKNIISKEFFQELNDLYDERNKAIHRFFISELDYSKIGEFCNRYEQTYEKLYDITYNLESEQIRMGVGMTEKGKGVTGEEKRAIYKNIFNKINH